MEKAVAAGKLWRRKKKTFSLNKLPVTSHWSGWWEN